jgi:large subunit ribosomal protein L6
MSRIGKLPIPMPKGVDVQIEETNSVTVKGPKGTLTQQLPTSMILVQEDGVLQVRRPDDTGPSRALHGLTRTLLNNMVVGVTTGFRKSLVITGVGYRVAKDGQDAVFTVGYSHPVRVTPPPGITFATEGNNRIHVDGTDKQMVGEIAARLRSIREPEPYLGKGIAYDGERIRRKQGKTGTKGKGKK